MSRRRERQLTSSLAGCLVLALMATGAVMATGGLSLAGRSVGRSAEAGERLQGRIPRTARALARVELGRRLFFDPQVSQSGQHSCASCHAPEHGFSDPDRGSTDGSGVTPRHSQTILDAAYNPTSHWDGEFSCVEELVTRRLGNEVIYYGGSRRTPRTPATPLPPNVVVDNGDEADDMPKARPFVRTKFPQALSRTSLVADRLNKYGRYAEAFKRAFGTGEVTLEHLALSIAAYCYSIESTRSPYDQYKRGDKAVLSPAARRGLVLFEGRAGCFECHDSKGRHALFTDYRYHNTGIAWNAAARASETTIDAEVGEPEDFDVGRMRFSGRKSEQRSFKTPTLRDVALRAPYMHDGRFQTLADVVRYYAKGCGTDPARSEHLKPFRAAERDVQDLVAFLKSLTGVERPGRARKAWSSRAAKTVLTLVDDKGEPLADLPIKLIPVGDEQPMPDAQTDKVLEGRTNAKGVVSFPPGTRTHMRIVLPEGLAVDGGSWIPDTCRKLTVSVPVQGQMTFIVAFGERVSPPTMLIAEHLAEKRDAGAEALELVRSARRVARRRGLPVRSAFLNLDASPTSPPRRTIFRRTEVANGEKVLVARYTAWITPADEGRVALRMPGHGWLGLSDLDLKANTVRRIDASTRD